MNVVIGAPMWVVGHHVTTLDTIGDYALLQIVTAPEVPGPPPHHHERFSELFYVADGVLEVMADGVWRRLEQGENLSIPAGVVHTFRNPGNRPATWLTGFSPRGFVQFFVAFGVPADQPNAQAASMAPEVFARLAREASDYDMIIERSRVS